MEEVLTKLKDLAVTVGSKLIYAIIILLIGTKLIKLLIKLLQKEKLFKKLDDSVKSFLISAIKTVLYIVLFLTIASILGVPLTSMVTLLGSAGLAIGLSLQGGLSNIAGGLIILVFKPFKVGDFIDTHSDSGTVKDISIFYTTLTTPDNRNITIPNGNLANQAVVNYSHNPKRRLDIDVQVSYDNKPDDVIKCLEKIVSNQKTLLEGEQVFIKITDYKDSSVTYTIRVWVNNGDYWDTKFNILSDIKTEFTKNNISIPYNQLDVHIEK